MGSDAQLVETKIDGRATQVRRDTWALEAARGMGIDIPTLCYHPALEPYGACRLCVVEVTRGKWTWLATSCDLPIREGLELRTDTPAVLAARRMALELLWAQAPESDLIAGLARSMGVREPRFAARNGTGKCILCGLCVRACSEVIGESAVCFSRRGAQRTVSTPFDKASPTCIGCGACVAICPTGHIRAQYEKGLLRLHTWHTDLELACCADCGKPYAPRRVVERIASSADAEIAQLARLCPICRSRDSAAKWAQALRLSVTILE